MSISVNSWESLVDLVSLYYDRNLPVYFDEKHVLLTCDIIAILLNRRDFPIIKTNVVLNEPIVAYENCIFLSIPLIALLVNKTVDMPPNKVEFVENFNIFDGLKSFVQTNENLKSTCRTSAADNILNNSSTTETVRFTQMLRIMIMCSHFHQHYIKQIPFTCHKNFNMIEVAKISKSANKRP